MFTGIVEEVGEVVALREEGGNRHFTLRARMALELKVDQSVAHNGACLTVVAVEGDTYTVTAVQETLQRCNLGDLQVGDGVNLERSLRMGDRLDGHMVQGHVDTVTPCLNVREEDGSWRFVFALPEQDRLLVPKGSICLDGVSLTIATLDAQTFSVAVIPYTFAHTTFRQLRPGRRVNVEYDVLGKYVQRMMAGR
ncbi:MAG: riboflavin synthase [Flavobacteriales bacterium]|nr:riboflavin synthase [Flavobacteriales bacterium]